MSQLKDGLINANPQKIFFRKNISICLLKEKSIEIQCPRATESRGILNEMCAMNVRGGIRKLRKRQLKMAGNEGGEKRIGATWF